jgi:hypothetical protein
MAVPNPQQYKGMRGSAPIVMQGQTAGSFGNEPMMKDRVDGPTPLKP